MKKGLCTWMGILLLFTVGMVGCSSDDSNNTVIGKWQLIAIDMDGTGVGTDKVMLRDYLQLNSDGTFKGVLPDDMIIFFNTRFGEIACTYTADSKNITTYYDNMMHGVFPYRIYADGEILWIGSPKTSNQEVDNSPNTPAYIYQRVE